MYTPTQINSHSALVNRHIKENNIASQTCTSRGDSVKINNAGVY